MPPPPPAAEGEPSALSVVVMVADVDAVAVMEARAVTLAVAVRGGRLARMGLRRGAPAAAHGRTQGSLVVVCGDEQATRGVGGAEAQRALSSVLCPLRVGAWPVAATTAGLKGPSCTADVQLG